MPSSPLAISELAKTRSIFHHMAREKTVLDPSASVVYVRSGVDITASVIDSCRDHFTAAIPLLDEKPAVKAPSDDEGEAPLAPTEPPAPPQTKASAPVKSKTVKK